ncbi:MAG: hypothetical protein AB1486_29045 [Planctomycetota bacterium]
MFLGRRGTGRQVWEFAPDAIVLAALGAAGLKLAGAVKASLDIGVADEARYLWNGLRLLSEGLPSPQWGPLYSTWYFLLSRLQGDPVELYFLSYSLLMTGVPLLLYIHLRQCRLPAFLAGLVAGLYLWSYTNLVVWPYPTRFANLLLLGFLIAAAPLRSWRDRSLLVLVALLVLSFVRPEYFVPFLVLSVLGIVFLLVQLLRGRQAVTRTDSVRYACFALVCTVLIAVFGSPLTGGRRQNAAFFQHFAVRWVASAGSDKNPWAEGREVAEEAFGKVKSPQEAFLANPRLVLEHICTNAGDTIERLVSDTVLLRPAGLVAGSSASRVIRRAVKWVVFVAAGIYAAIPLWRLVRLRHPVQRRAVPHGMRGFLANFRERLLASGPHLLGLQLLLLAGVSLAVVPAVLLVYPRYHYLQVLGLLLTILWARAVSRCLRALRASPGSAFIRHASGILTAGLTAWVLVSGSPADAGEATLLRPARGGPAARGGGGDTAGRPYLMTVSLLRELEFKEPVKIVSPRFSEAGFNVYLKGDGASVSPALNDGGFFEFLEKHDIGVIVWPHKIAELRWFKEDQEYACFLASPAQHGFVELPVPGTALTILVRRDRLCAAPAANQTGR